MGAKLFYLMGVGVGVGERGGKETLKGGRGELVKGQNFQISSSIKGIHI